MIIQGFLFLVFTLLVLQNVSKIDMYLFHSSISTAFSTFEAVNSQASIFFLVFIVTSIFVTAYRIIVR